MQRGGELLRTALGVLDGLDQHGDRFFSRRQGDAGYGRIPERLLAVRYGRIGGEIDVAALVSFALQAGMLMELPKKGTRGQAQALAQFGGGEAAGGLADYGHEGLRQMAVA